MELIYFLAVAAVAVLAALAAITSRNTVHSALFMVAVLFCVAMLYLSLAAEFLAVVQVTVYAGAIMVLFLFVITVLNPGQEEGPNRIVNRVPLAVSIAMVFLVGVSAFLRPEVLEGVVGVAKSSPADFNSLEAVGGMLFTQYLVPFELTSLLLLVAMVAAMVLGKRRA